jgi:hypothetical protein
MTTNLVDKFQVTVVFRDGYRAVQNVATREEAILKAKQYAAEAAQRDNDGVRFTADRIEACDLEANSLVFIWQRRAYEASDPED